MERSQSRLIKKQRSSALRQTTLFIFGAILLTFLFIFVILPLFIALVNNYLNRNPFTESEVVILQAPVINAPPIATNNRQVTITGYSPTGKNVVLILNSREAGRTQTNEEGEFSISFQAINGANIIAFYAEDDKGNQSPTSKEYEIEFDQNPPELVLNQPEENQTFDKKTQAITVTGVSDPLATVLVNNRRASINTDGQFTTSIQLQKGENKILIKATDPAGNFTELERVVKLME